MAHLEPLPKDHTPELADDFELFESILGFVPNSLLTMQRRPDIVKAFGQLTRAVMDPGGSVDPAFKRVLAHMASHAAGCQYCEAHSLVAAELKGMDREKLAALWDYRDSPLFSEAERVAMDFALGAASVPNGVDDELFARMAKHWGEGEIVEILAAISLYGFLNRWNDSMATDLEESPRRMGQEMLGRKGWSGGKHVDR